MPRVLRGSRLAHGREYGKHSTRIMRATLLFSFFLISLLCHGPVGAQPSPYGSADGNLGTWTWGKPQPSQDNEGAGRAPGETSWERLHAEHQPAGEQPTKDTPLINNLSPLRWWRLLRGKHDEPDVQQDDGQNKEQPGEENDEQADEPGGE